MPNYQARYKKSRLLTNILIIKVSNFFVKYKSAILTVLLLSIAGQTAIQYMLFNLKSDATLINIAGRQRMLGQEIVKTLIINTKPDLKLRNLKNLKIEWKNRLNEIRHSDSLGDIDFKNKDQKFKVLFSQAQLFQKKIIQWNIQKEPLENLLKYDENFKLRMNELVFYLQDITNKKIHHLRIFEAFIFIFSCIILFCEYFFLLKKTRGNFELLFKRFKTENLLSNFFLSSEEHFFCVISKEKKVLNCNISWEKSNLPQIGDHDKLISKLLLTENTTTRVKTEKDGLKIVKWSSKKAEKGTYFLWGYDVTNEYIANNKLLHDNKVHILGKASAGLAHEIKNPLTFIKTNLDIIKLQVSKKRQIPEEVINSTQEGITRIDEIINDFRLKASENLSNITVPSKKDQTKSINLKQHISKSLKMSMITSDKNIKIIDESCEKSNIVFNSGQMTQCLINIFQNSIESLALKKEGREIRISTLTTSTKVHLKISDNGEGCEGDKINNIFEPFTSYGREKYNNSGLGLHICREIIKENGGNISANQKEGVFTVNLELMRDQFSTQDNNPLQILS